jgi:hypothetical protein
VRGAKGVVQVQQQEEKLMTAGEVRTLTALIGELGSTNFDAAIGANFGNLPDDAEVALDVVAVLFPPSAPFDVAAEFCSKSRPIGRRLSTSRRIRIQSPTPRRPRPAPAVFDRRPNSETSP